MILNILDLCYDCYRKVWIDLEKILKLHLHYTPYLDN